MKGKRILTALIAAALTAGVTYAYTKPVQDRNQIAFWRTADGTQVDAYNIYGQPVTTYYFPSSNQPPNVIVRNAYDRDGNRLRTSRTLAEVQSIWNCGGRTTERDAFCPRHKRRDKTSW